VIQPYDRHSLWQCRQNCVHESHPVKFNSVGTCIQRLILPMVSLRPFKSIDQYCWPTAATSQCGQLRSCA
jgi:hypothetical protein